MKSSRRLRTPSPAMIVALVALFVALSGGAAAGTYVAAKELDTRATSLEPGNATIPRVVAARVAQLRALSLRPDKLHKCCRGPRGPRGFRGPRGPQGPAGRFTAANISSTNGPVVHLCAFGGGGCEVGQSIAICPGGTVPIGGAWAGDSPDPIVDATVGASFPYPSGSPPTGWGLIIINNAPITASFHVAAICAG
jgi:hypothetical protein